MKSLIALLALLLISSVSAESSLTHIENAAWQFLRNSSEAEIEFRYELKQSIDQQKLTRKKRLHSRKIEQIYCYRIFYRKTPDGRLQYEIKSQTRINGKFSSRAARV